MSNVIAYFLRAQLVVPTLLVIGLAVAATWLLRKRLGGRARQGLFLLFSLSIGAVVVVTLLREAQFTFCPTCLGDWTGVDKILTGAVGTDVALNVVLFVPAAFFATLLWRAPWRTAGIAALASLAIEVVQPIVGVGANDLMDLLVNTVGALIGAGAGTLVVLAGDAIAHKQLDIGRTVKLAVSLLVGAMILVGGPAWAASAKQADATARLQALFAGTTLADYQANRETTWQAKLEQFWAETGQITVTSLSNDAVALERSSWNIYFAERCVIGQWTPTGFDAISLSGASCTDPLERHI